MKNKTDLLFDIVATKAIADYAEEKDLSIDEVLNLIKHKDKKVIEELSERSAKLVIEILKP